MTSTTAVREGSRKRYFTGTHRIRPPEQTWERVSPLFPRMGITRVADVTGLDRLGIPVYQSVRPASRNLSVSQGKGLTRAAARVSAAMESVEMWHAECLDHVPQVRASLQEMRYANPIDAEALRWMRGTRSFRSLPLEWVEARSLASDRTAWLPRDMIELDFRAPDLFVPEMFVRNSNGLASGNDLNEALLHGLCELIERHAWHLTQVEPERLLAVDPTTIDSEPFQRMIRRIHEAGFKLGVYDFTWEIGIPAAFVKLVAPDMPVVWHGAGCHTSAEVAVCRALTEAAQSRLTLIAGARDDLIGLAKGVRLHSSFEAYEEPSALRSFHAMPDLSTGDVAEDVALVVERLEVFGFEPFCVDLSRADIGVSVALAFAPGLREMHG